MGDTGTRRPARLRQRQPPRQRGAQRMRSTTGHPQHLRAAPDHCQTALTPVGAWSTSLEKEITTVIVDDPKVTLEVEAHGFPEESRDTAQLDWALVASVIGDDGKHYWFNIGAMSLREAWG